MKRNSQKRKETEIIIQVPICLICENFELNGPRGSHETFLQCVTCGYSFHPSCLQLPESTSVYARTYHWQCSECKECQVCGEHGDQESSELLLFCERCDKGTHTFCLDPPLGEIPNDEWLCGQCKNTRTKRGLYLSQPSTPITSSEANSIRKKKIRKGKASVESPLISLVTPKPNQRHRDIYSRNNSKNNSKNKIVKNNSKSIENIFANILSPQESDLSLCMPTQYDQNLFDKAHSSLTPHLSFTASLESLQSVAADPLPRVPQIQFGQYIIDTWYSAPYPEEYNYLHVVYTCEFCLRFLKSKFTLQRHMEKCTARHPPGDEIYRDGSLSVFEVDGRKNKIYCQNLCILAKVFLDHKTLFYDTEPFLFYILTEYNETGFHFVGYFSKEKRSSANYNLSCIVTLPVFQRKGYGNFLIEFSYLLSQKEGKKGSPEKPLSDLGLLTYRRFWRYRILQVLQSWKELQVSIHDLSNFTSMTLDDVVSTLYLLDMLSKNEQGQYIITLDKKAVNIYLGKLEKKAHPRAKEECLQWLPFPMKRSIPSILQSRQSSPQKSPPSTSTCSLS